MDLITLLGTLESNLTRELVSTIHGDTISYTADTPKTITINNSTTHTNVNRVCIIAEDNTKLYVSSYDYKKLSSIDISTITSISIT